MQTIREVLDLPVVGSYDVVVVGGGTAGSLAAIAAARNGAKTLCIEAQGFLGGSATGALVMPLMGNHVDGKPLNKGLGLEVMQALAETGDCGESYGNLGWFNPEMLKYVLEQKALEAGVELAYHTWFSAPIVEGDAIKGVIVENKGGRQAILAKVVIDASGDADVAFRAKVPCESGRASDGKNQALSLRFNLANVDLDRLTTFLKEVDPHYHLNPPFAHGAHVWGKEYPITPLFRQAVEEGVLEHSDGDYFQFFGIPGRPGELGLNCPRISERVNATDPGDLTNAQIVGKEKILRLVNFMRKYIPGCEKAYLGATAVQVGIRETRRIRGEYQLTGEDYAQLRKFDDAVARNRYPIDIHNPEKGGGVTFPPHLPAGEYHEIPYRCLVPQKIEGLLVAGRCISATFEAQSAIRIQPNCHALGEAAGVAAAMAVKEGVTPRQLDGTKVRALLKEQGAGL